MPIAEHFAAECPSTEATRTFTLNAHWPEYPYPGLRPFRVTSSSDESLIFYGRNAQKDDILDRLNKAHTGFVLAPSGCGKPSLIKAGVIPALEAGLLTRAGHRWRSAEMRPGSRPLASLSKAFASIPPEPNARVSGEIDDLLRSQPSGLWLAFECVRSSMSQDAKDWSLLLLLDQFEEVFGNQIVDRTEVDQLMRLVAGFFAKPPDTLTAFGCVPRLMASGHCANAEAHEWSRDDRGYWWRPILGWAREALRGRAQRSGEGRLQGT